MYQSHEFYLLRCIEISKDSRAHGNAPFGALLVDKDGNILMEQENIEITERSAPAMPRRRLRRAPPMSTPRRFCGIAPCTPPRSRALCAPAPSTGRTSAAWYTA